MNRGRITKLNRLTDVASGQPGGQVAAGVPHRQIPVSADVADGPPVAVLHPITGRKAQPAVVAAGDDHIPDTGPIPIRQLNLRASRGAVESVGAGAVIEVGTWARVGASMIASRPAARSAAQAAKASCVVVARSPTCTRP